uniref:Ribokinase n=1 Tax=Vannella robusta TaxID=1487602 RepID=A0A7S4M569_9EUKA
MSSGAVAVVGACNVDLISYVPRLPVEGETLKGTSFEQGFGGKGANQAVQARLLGADTIFISKLGEDSYGKQYRDKLQEYGIKDEFVFSDAKQSTGLAPIAVDSKGNNSIIIIPGANDLLSSEELERSKEAIKNCKVFVAQLELPLAINQEALKLAHSLGVTTILNTAPAPSEPLPEAIYEDIDILCANQPEIEMLTELKASTREEAEKAARKIISLGASQVLLTLGAKGCLLVTKEGEPIYIEGESVDSVVDTSGAGDSFLGAFAYFYSIGNSMEESMKKANYVAAQSVTKNGTQSSYCARDDLPSAFFE